MLSVSPIFVSTAGLSGKSRQSLESFFSQYKDLNFALVSEHELADVTFIDPENFTRPERIKSFIKQLSERTIVFFSKNTVTLDNLNILHIQKPVQREALKTTLLNIQRKWFNQKRAASNTDSTPTTTHQDELSTLKKPSFISTKQKDLDSMQTEDIETIRYFPEQMFQGKVKQAIEISKNHNALVKLSHGDHQLYFIPVTREVYLNLSETLLRGLCVGEWPFNLHIEENHELTSQIVQRLNAKNEYHKTKMEALLWKIALWTSKGKLSNTQALTQPVYLSKLPLFVPQQELPQTAIIASELARHPLNLLELSDQLHIPQKFIFAFFSAAEAIGVVSLTQVQGKATLTSLKPLSSKISSHSKKDLPTSSKRTISQANYLKKQVND